MLSWFTTAEGQLIQLAHGQFTIVSTNWNLRGAAATSICLDNQGTLWVGTDEGVAQYQGGYPALQPR